MAEFIVGYTYKAIGGACRGSVIVPRSPQDPGSKKINVHIVTGRGNLRGGDGMDGTHRFDIKYWEIMGQPVVKCPKCRKTVQIDILGLCPECAWVLKGVAR